MSEFLAPSHQSSSGGASTSTSTNSKSWPTVENWMVPFAWLVDMDPWMEDGFPGWKQASERAGLVS
jgi:hypothetical protein